MSVTFVLVHSPLVGPSTWSLVAGELRRREFDAIVPTLSGSPGTLPYWEHHATQAAQTLMSIPLDAPVVLVGHSGAGTLLPAIRQLARRNVAGYIFVDAGIPIDGFSHLDLRALESVEFAERFRRALQSGERFPAWSEEDLRDLLPDESLRQRIVSELQPRSLDFFDEPIPVFDGWPDAPCSYVQFTETYDVFAEEARGKGWPVQRIEGGHFHMLVDPEAVTTALVGAVVV